MLSVLICSCYVSIVLYDFFLYYLVLFKNMSLMAM